MAEKFKIEEGAANWAKYSLGLPVFFLVFSLLYRPFGITEYFSLGSFGYIFHLLMFFCIILLIISISRIILINTGLREKSDLIQYIVYCAGEIIICSAFIALYITIFKHDFSLYFFNLANCLKITFLTLAYPYSILILFQLFVSAKNGTLEQPQNLVKFYDEHKKLKLSIEAASILSIKAEDNYVRISYTEGNSIKEYLLRNSMKSQQENTSPYGLVRCHRSYIVNPAHIKVLSRDSQGQISATLDTAETFSVPVSKQYYEALSSLL